MKTSTNVELKGWMNTFVPKSLDVNVREWLLENEMTEDDARVFEPDTTFADLRSCAKVIDKFGNRTLDYDRLGAFCTTDDMDSTLRDITFDAAFAIIN